MQFHTSECVEFNIPLRTITGHFEDETLTPAYHLAMVLMKQTYNTQDKHKKP